MSSKIISLTAASLVLLTGAVAFAQDNDATPTASPPPALQQVTPVPVPQKPVVTQVEPTMTAGRPTLDSGNITLKPGTFVIKNGVTQICIKPKFPKQNPALVERAKHLRAVRETLRSLSDKVSPAVRKRLKGALDLLEKLKDPCGKLPTVMMGRSAVCQGGSGN